MKVRKNKLNESINDWKEVASKEVFDSDNFITDYTWYTNGEKHIFMFGDKDIEEPDEDYADWECDSEEEAQEWFDNYDEHEDSEWLADYDKDDEYYFESIKNKRKSFKKGANENIKIKTHESINSIRAKNLLESKGKDFEIWFDDLKKDVQNALLNEFDIENPGQINWDDPIATVYEDDILDLMDDYTDDYDEYEGDDFNENMKIRTNESMGLRRAKRLLGSRGYIVTKRRLREAIDYLDCDATLLPESDDNGPLEDYLDPEEYEEIEDYIYSDGTIVATKGSYLTIKFDDGKRFTLPKDYFEIEC